MDEAVRWELTRTFGGLAGVGALLLIVTCTVIWWKGKKEREAREAVGYGQAEKGLIPGTISPDDAQKSKRTRKRVDFEPKIRFGRTPSQKRYQRTRLEKK